MYIDAPPVCKIDTVCVWRRISHGAVRVCTYGGQCPWPDADCFEIGNNISKINAIQSQSYLLTPITPTIYLNTAAPCHLVVCCTSIYHMYPLYSTPSRTLSLIARHGTDWAGISRGSPSPTPP